MSTRGLPAPSRPVAPIDGAPRAMVACRIAVIGVCVLLAGCEGIVESLADQSDPGHAGARAHSIRDHDAYGNLIDPRGNALPPIDR